MEGQNFSFFPLTSVANGEKIEDFIGYTSTIFFLIYRLEILFSLRQTWKATEIQQFLSDLCPTLRLLNEMYMKYCRQTTVNGEKVLAGLKEAVL